jgi:hypothetical protein
VPSVIDAPEIVEHEEHAIYKEHTLVRKAHPGFWYTVLRFVKRHRVPTPHGTPSSSHGPLHLIETPAALLAREYPSLYIRANAGV